jgi:uncharacterized membrane protein
MKTTQLLHRGAVGSLVLLILWLLAWELWVAPLKPGGSLLALKVVLLLVPLRGVIKRDLYTMQWTSMAVLLYFAEGVVRAWSDMQELSRMMAAGEVVLVLAYFVCALLYLRPYKQEARRIARELLDKVNTPK